MSSPVLRVAEIALEKIKPDPNQVRRVFDEESIAGLALSIEADELQSPIRVRAMADGLFQIVTGERRFKAFQRLGRKTIPAFVVQDTLAPQKQTVQQLVENVQREGLNAIDLAHAFQRLMQESGWNGQQVAEKLGIAPATVSRHLRLLDSEAELQDAVANGKLPASTAYELLAIDNPSQRMELFKQAMSGSIKREDVTRARRSSSASATFARTTLVLDAARSITIGAATPTLDTLLGMFEEAASHLRKARSKGISIATLVRMLKDQARQSSNTVVRPEAGAV